MSNNTEIESGFADQQDGHFSSIEIEHRMNSVKKLMKGLRSLESSSVRDKTHPPPLTPPQPIQPGSTVILHSLKSKIGQTLNEKRGLVLDNVVVKGEDRLNVKVESKFDRTMALKVDNLAPFAWPPNENRDPHPDYHDLIEWQMTSSQRLSSGQIPEKKFRNARGIAYDDDDAVRRARKFVELLDKPRSGYEPPATVLAGEAARWYSSIGERNFQSNLTGCQLEHVAGFLALTAMCQGTAPRCLEQEGREAVLFALLEVNGDVALDVVMDFIILTPYIGPEEIFETKEMSKAFEDVQHRADNELGLTPGQTNLAYIQVMSYGPMGLLLELSGCLGGEIVFRKIGAHEYFGLFVQRMLHFASREAMGTKDGLALGRHARGILASLCGKKKKLTTIIREKPFLISAAGVLLQQTEIWTTHDLVSLFNRILPDHAN